MEDLTWVELKARVDAGAKAVIVPTGGVEQNGSYIALGKHNWVVAHAAQEIASILGNTLVAPVVRVVPQGDMAKSGSSVQALEGSSPSLRQPSVAISPVWPSNVLWQTLRKSFA